MNIKELFEKIYNNEILNDDVIRQIDLKGVEYDSYILHNDDEYWFYGGDGIISLDYYNKENEHYKYEIIKVQEFNTMIEEEERQEKIKKLELELESLKMEV